jgi:hypothetical protein
VLLLVFSHLLSSIRNYFSTSVFVKSTCSKSFDAEHAIQKIRAAELLHLHAPGDAIRKVSSVSSPDATLVFLYIYAWTHVS